MTQKQRLHLFKKKQKEIHLLTNLEKVGHGCVKTLTHHKFKVGTY
jgi:hypothetical protein